MLKFRMPRTYIPNLTVRTTKEDTISEYKWLGILSSYLKKKELVLQEKVKISLSFVF